MYKVKEMRKEDEKILTRKLTKCRTCYAGNGEVPIFNNSIQSNISQEIEKITGVVINFSDKYPQHICRCCLDLLNACIIFRDMCQRTNEMFLESAANINEGIQTKELKLVIDNYDELDNIESSPVKQECWECFYCYKGFSDEESCNNHVSKCKSTITTENNKPFEKGIKRKYLCDICGKTCYSNTSLSVHMCIHENIFPHKCDQCPYQGRTMDLLKVHKRSHMTDKPFKCTHCSKTTTTASNLAKHTKQVHSTKRPFKCSYCEKAFSYQHDMNRHIRDIHLRQEQVECDICFKKFNTRKILRGHQWKVHKLKGDRHGRLPSYLQCQKDEQEKTNADAITRTCDNEVSTL